MLRSLRNSFCVNPGVKSDRADVGEVMRWGDIEGARRDVIQPSLSSQQCNVTLPSRREGRRTVERGNAGNNRGRAALPAPRKAGRINLGFSPGGRLSLARFESSEPRLPEMPHAEISRATAAYGGRT